MSCTQEEMKKAVECGYWHPDLYRPREKPPPSPHKKE